MKKAALIFVSLIIAVSCTACNPMESLGNLIGETSSAISDIVSSEEEKETEEAAPKKTYDIALVTDVKGLDDKTNMSLWRSVITYGDTNNKTYKYYIADDIEENGEQTIEQAINNDAKIVVLPSTYFKNSVLSLQETYPDVSFLMVNAQNDSQFADNVHCVKFREEQAGYLAGYLAVTEGYTKLGFIGYKENDPNMRYIYGMVQGADDATQELRLHDVKIKYAFSEPKESSAKSVAEAMYKDGAEIIFACNDEIIKGVADVAQNEGKRLICGETLHDEYDKSVVLTSIVYDVATAGDYAIKTCFDEDLKWLDTNNDKKLNVGIAEGCIKIPTSDSSWNFTAFNSAFYDQLYTKIANGDIEISSKTDSKPAIAKVTYSQLKLDNEKKD